MTVQQGAVGGRVLPRASLYLSLSHTRVPAFHPAHAMLAAAGLFAAFCLACFAFACSSDPEGGRWLSVCVRSTLLPLVSLPPFPSPLCLCLCLCLLSLCLSFPLCHFPPLSVSLSFCLLPLGSSPQHDAQMDYYGKKLATCSSDRTVKIFDVREGPDGQERHTLVKELHGFVWWLLLRVPSLLRVCEGGSGVWWWVGAAGRGGLPLPDTATVDTVHARGCGCGCGCVRGVWVGPFVFACRASCVDAGTDPAGTKAPSGKWRGHTQCSGTCLPRARTTAK